MLGGPKPVNGKLHGRRAGQPEPELGAITTNFLSGKKAPHD